MRSSIIAVLLLLLLAGIWRWGAVVASPNVLPDERSYIEAARHLAAGESAYEEPTYLYPSLLARAVAWMSPRLGEIRTLQVFRGLSLGGTLLLVTLALTLVTWSWPIRALTGVSYIAYAPAVRIGTDLGNIAGLCSSLVLVTLLCWHRRPILSGAALGLGLALKPIAPLAPLALAFHRPRNPMRRQWTAAGVCAAVAALALIPDFLRLPQALANSSKPGSAYNFSLHKVLEGLGLPLSATAVFIVSAGGLLLFIRSRPVGRRALLITAIAFSVVSLPVLWAHSLLVFLPVQLLATDRAARVLIPSAETSQQQRPLAVLALTAVVASLLPHAAGSVHGLPDWSAPIILAYPLLAVVLVTFYALGTTRV